MAKNKERSKRQEPRIPVFIVVPLIGIILGMAAGLSLSAYETRSKINDIYATTTNIAMTQIVGEATRADMIQQTATAAPLDAMNPLVRSSIHTIYPDQQQLCGSTTLRVGKHDHDDDPTTPDLTQIQDVTVYHCINTIEPSFRIRLPSGEKVEADLVNITPLGDIPTSELDGLDPVTLFIYTIGGHYYDQIAHLDGVVELVDGTNLTGTDVSYCGYNSFVNMTADSKGLPFSLKCDNAGIQGYDEDGMALMKPAAIWKGDSGGSATIGNSHYVFGVISGLPNPLKPEVGYTTDVTRVSPVPPLGDNMAKIQWDFAMQGYR